MEFPALPEKHLQCFMEALNPAAAKVLIALSGGADSMALFIAACTVLGSEKVCACWVNHGLRSQSELAKEETLVKTVCKSYKAALMVETIQPGFLASEAPVYGGVEAAARHYRYLALEKARKSMACDLILTGHNANDWLETIIMRFFQGAGLSGLQGISGQHGKIGRPFLKLWHKDLLNYLKLKNQAYSTDSSNLSDDYLRNRVRHHVLPVVLENFPALYKTMLLSSKKAALDESALDFYAESLLIKDSLGKLFIETNAFDFSPVAIRERALYKLLIKDRRTRFPWRLVYSAASSVKKEGRLASGAGIEFYRKEGHIYVVPEKKAEELDVLTCAAAGFAFRAETPGQYSISSRLSCTLYLRQEGPGLRLDAFEWPVWIRTRLSGDSISCSAGTKSLDALTDPGARNAYTPDLVIEDKRGIAAFVPSGDFSVATFRKNDKLSAAAAGYLIIDMKGDMKKNGT